MNRLVMQIQRRFSERLGECLKSMAVQGDIPRSTANTHHRRLGNQI
jgi:hypothetical protein